ncbi:dihydroorotase [Dethiosulfatibacter aminovorans DSM 17477]|uniref:Dihydroorotase n=1 Tax=Dethiosulfatibacter aminovorans DSM 17477 TaxID=1121476 RepID=A0A1M6AGN8_9FIRM|nr:dihydroorotase [Dethiosulfatibacter aminovorans]SHI35680.1 dihydroorotase [Dethiosulfatibacter aminovorans DSM 17477]
MNIIIENVNIVDSRKTEYGKIVIENGIIVDPSSISEDMDYEIIDGRGLTALPSFADTHTHFREPGFEYKETLETGSKAAARGGYTSVLLMGNTNPPCSSSKVINKVINKGKEIGLVEILQAGTISDGIKGESLDHLDDVRTATSFITDDGKGVMNDKLMYDAMNYARENGLIVVSHAEDHYFSDTDMRLAENLMTFRDIDLCRITGARLHLAHVSTVEAVERIIAAKEEGLPVTFEVTPHHIFGDSSLVYRVNPPLREQKDIDAIIEAIREGYVDSIGTDHAPHTAEDKKNGSPGISGIETSFPICYTVLVRQNGITLNELSRIMSENPSRILGLNKGLIEEGYEGDIVLVETDTEYEIDSSQFVSKGKNTPFDGRKVFGKVMMTIKHGNIVYKGADYDSRQAL